MSATTANFFSASTMLTFSFWKCFYNFFSSLKTCKYFKWRWWRRTTLSKEKDYLWIESHRFPKDQPATRPNQLVGLHTWTNLICTAQYSWWDFLPRNIFSQLILPYNLYFVFLAILQSIPSISDSNGYPTFLLPLSLVMGITAAKDAYEDIQRHRADDEENRKMCYTFRDGKLVKLYWKDLIPGDIVKLTADEDIPADMLLINCSDVYGITYVETQNLDGETNLKNKFCIPDISAYVPNDEAAAKATFQVFFDPPSVDLYYFNGRIIMPESPYSLRLRFDASIPTTALLAAHRYTAKQYFLTNSQLLLRGATLKNSKWAYGLVLYTGLNTRIFKNSKYRTLKYSTLHRNFIKHTWILVSIQVFLCLLASILGLIREQYFTDSAWYLGLSQLSSAQQFISSLGLGFGRFFLLLSFIVPISLLVQLQICRFFQARALPADTAMAEVASFKTAAQTISVMEELGSITHVFTDKTGTLTKNVMEFQCLSFFGYRFSRHDHFTRKEPKMTLSDTNTISHVSTTSAIAIPSVLSQSELQTNTTTATTTSSAEFDGFHFLESLKTFTPHMQYLAGKFLLTLAVCHSVVSNTGVPPTTDLPPPSDSPLQRSTVAASMDPRNEKTKEILSQAPSASPQGVASPVTLHPIFSTDARAYDACSPDELALVNAAKAMGVQFYQRPFLSCIQLALTHPLWESLLLSVDDHTHLQHVRAATPPRAAFSPLATYDVLEVMEFDNTRKRMSVIIRDRFGQLNVLSKGADTAMLSVAAAGQDAQLVDVKEELEDIASSGLRTLVMGFRVIEEEELEMFRKILNSEACDDSNERKEAAYKYIESDLIILGCTGIEDKLQDEVPETIEKLRSAGLNIWVLTGDKIETAISVGYSCNILTNTTHNAIVDRMTTQEVFNQLLEHLYHIVGAQLAGDYFDIYYEHPQETQEEGGSEVYREKNKRSLPKESKWEDQRLQTGGDDGPSPVATGLFGFCQPGGLSFRPSCRGITGGLEPQTMKARKKRTRPTMLAENFFKVLRFSARRKIIKADPIQAEAKSLTPKQIERIILHYVNELYPKEASKETSSPATPSSPIEKDGLKNVHTPDDMWSPLRAKLKFSTALSETCVEGYEKCALIVTGDALKLILESSLSKRYFFALANVCSTVIVCRASPKQKSDILIEYGKFHQAVVSLAIGDGANDVGMLISANVGVGILGKEGSQAARAADFAMHEFRYLQNLLFFHGRESLRRNSIHVYHTIWKNVLFGTANFFFGFSSAFSAVELYNSWIKQFFNLLFTTIPIIWYSVTDVQLSYHVIMKNTFIYPCRMGGNHLYTGRRLFFRWLVYAFYCALTIIIMTSAYIVPSHALASMGLVMFGTVTFLICVIVSNLAIIPFVHTWNITLVILLVLDVIFWYLTVYICSILPLNLCPELKGVLFEVHSQFSFYLVTFFIVSITVLPQMYSWFYKIFRSPTPAMVLRATGRKGLDGVLVPSLHDTKYATIVPKREENKHTGFAFAEQEASAYSHRQNSIQLQWSLSNES